VEEILMRRLTCELIVFLCFCVPGFAQTGNATLSGRVTDQSKALVVGARVVVTDIDTNISRETKTNGDGYYSVGSLPPGPYKVEIDKVGFENIVKPDLILHTQDVLEINFELRVGSSSETITVVDSSPTINTSPSVSMTWPSFCTKFPAMERFGIVAQLRRSVVSVAANIAEVHARATTQDFSHFLPVAKGSLMETETLLMLAVRLGYVSQHEAERR
jgi:four helix bundle protein